MDITKSREAFEAWLTSEYDWGAGTLDKAHFQGDDKTGYYIGGEFLYEGSSCGEALFWAWRGWQARHSSFEVDLPTQDEYDDPLSAYNAISDCKKILRTAGIRIKGESE
ncbi:hypothetical protein [Yersinia rochesterensis]|uniref:hypothetical protein n=1 Tax=Yersinia rochesterensis TaxID=1604335 RepID=UPI001643BA96|nr:hypothetical protein [Yersinia rochesterensis]